MKQKPIYVETRIKAPIEDIWEKTQDPKQHEQWDIRFSSITYLPKEPDQAQQFTYTRKMLPGIEIVGWGESVGNHTNKDGWKSSSLHFGTDQKISPIKEGRGYWQYIPNDETGDVTFLTSYNYQANFGKIGQILDKVCFRPIMGWGTALSFDILKRWLEKGETPYSQYIRFFMIHTFAILFAFIWIYHGLIPKIIAMHPEEVMMTGRLFPFGDKALQTTIIIIGIIEIIYGITWLVYRHKRHLFALQSILFPMLMTSALIADSQTAMHPFNPITFNITLIILSIIGWIISKDTPTARNCRRKQAKP